MDETKLFKSDVERRKFLKASIVGGVSVFHLPLKLDTLFSKNKKVKFGLTLDIATQLFDENRRSWAHPRVGIIPGAGKDGLPRVVMTMNLISGSDVFNTVYGIESDDLGKTWSKSEEITSLAPQYETINDVLRPVVVSDFWPQWHKNSKVLLGTGHTVVYEADWKFVPGSGPRHTSYAVYNTDTNTWFPWQKLEMPDTEKFYSCGAGSTQRYDEKDGSILLPVYFSSRGAGKKNSVCIVRCRFDGGKIQCVEYGNKLTIDVSRGFVEPSITFFKGWYFLTIRNDEQGYVAKSADGLHFDEPIPWTFNDGSDLGNYNTQQHWVTHSDGLFLVYTRRGANNDHVFRHRAPLFMAQVDPDKLCIIRETECVLVPDRGATLGNFGVTDVSENETWVTTAEIMLTPGVEKYGSNGNVFVARIHWDKPNRNF